MVVYLAFGRDRPTRNETRDDARPVSGKAAPSEATERDRGQLFFDPDEIFGSGGPMGGGDDWLSDSSDTGHESGD